MNSYLDGEYYNIKENGVYSIAKYYKDKDYWQIYNTRIIFSTDEIEIFDKVNKPTWGTEYK